MRFKIIRSLSLFFTALGLAPGMAHTLELPNKINLSDEEYLTVQQLYRGWAFLGIVELAALISTLLLAIKSRKRPKAFARTLLAFLCIAANLAIFFTFTYPANQRTNNWTVLPDNWMELRRQWEYSHATNAGLYIVALIALILALPDGREVKASSHNLP